MSADNGIYIHKFRNGYKVIHAQAIENVYWWKENNKWVEKDKINPKILYDYFKDSPIFKTEDEAYKYAFKLYKEHGYVEYGVCEI